MQPSIKAAAEERSSRAAGAARVAAEVMFAWFFNPKQYDTWRRNRIWLKAIPISHHGAKNENAFALWLE